MKSWQKPTEQQINKALSALVHLPNLRFFFDKLENPEWLEPLAKRAFFNNPPDIIKDEKKGTIGFPPWPVSNYLARMAELKPQEVLAIINKIPDNGNIRVYQDFIEALLRMPPEISVKLLKRVKKWIASTYKITSPEKLGELIIHFAKGGFIDEAFELADAILFIQSDKKAEDKIKAINIPSEPKTIISLYDYEEIVKKYFPSFIELVGIRGITFLCKLLLRAIHLSQNYNEKNKVEDYSYIWRPAIEAHDQNIGMGLRDILIDGIRDSAEILISKGILKIFEILDIFKSFKKKIFLRLKIYVLYKFGDKDFKEIESVLNNKEYFNDNSIRHEFVLLLKTFFPKLSKEIQNFIFDLIYKGPGEEFYKRIEKYQERQFTEKERIKEQEKWKLPRYFWINNSLIGKYKEEYDELIKKYGEPKNSEFISFGASWVGPTSPKTSEELINMTPTGLIDFLNQWKYKDEIFAPTPEGLSRSMIEVIKNKPAPYMDFALEFKGLNPTYVRSLISGVAESNNLSSSLNWQAILNLCSWVVLQQDETIKSGEKKWDEDPDWGWTRKSVADLLNSIFQKNILPYSFKDKSWEVLKILTDDPEPSTDYEEEYGGTNMDPSTLSINTVRGKAMHALIQYALWIRRYHEKLPDAKKFKNNGFIEMPEVKEVLEKHLDPSLDPSLAIRSIYGRWLPWIALLDEKWLVKNLSLIFPSQENKSLLRDAAWESYIVFCRPFNNILPILSSQYKIAITKIGTRKELHSHYSPNEKLAEHLMEFYWRGILNFDNYNKIFKDFWNTPDFELKGYALEFIGRSLKNTKDPLSADLSNRLKLLWGNRLSHSKLTEKNEYEMRAFEWWFISNKFDRDWEIKQLKESLNLGGRFNGYIDSEVVNRLAEFTKTYPVETIKCLELIAKSDEEGWGIYSWAKQAKYIISATMKTAASDEAKSLVNYLGSRGYLEFGDLL